MVQNNILKLIGLLQGNSLGHGIVAYADGISGILLVLLAIAVLLEFVRIDNKQKKVKQRSFVAVSVMGAFLFIEFFIGRNGLGNIDMGLKMNSLLAFLGVLAVAFGVILNIVARVQLGKNWSNSIVIYSEQKLVKNGLYGLVRHPLYSTIFLISIGLVIQYQNYISAILTFVAFLPLIFLRIIQEEKVLKENLDGYKEYSEITPMLCPLSLSLFFTKKEEKINTFALRSCRITTVLILLISLYFQIPWLIILAIFLMMSSAIVSIGESPVIIFYKYIFRKMHQAREESVDINAIRFAQGLGSVLLICAYSLINIFAHAYGGWIFVSIVIFSTTLGSTGYCFGAQIYFILRKLYKPNA